MQRDRWPKRRVRVVAFCVLVAFALGFVAYLAGAGVGGADDPIAVNGTLHFDGEDVRYHEENGTVEFVAARGANRTVYSATSFEEYSKWRCTEVALAAIRGELVDRHDFRPGGRPDDEHDHVTTGQGTDEVRVTALLDPLATPNYYQLERSLPKEVEVTLEYEGGSRTCTVPVDVDGTLRPPRALSLTAPSLGAGG